jgi:formyltetrahydrofolate deformylase
MNQPPTTHQPTNAAGLGVLLLRCSDQPGLVAEVAGFIALHGGNIVDAQQHTDTATNGFFQRVTFELDGMDLEPAALAVAFAPVAARLGMSAELHLGGHRPRVAILASRQNHCVLDLLHRWQANDLAMDPVAVVSNHTDVADVASWFDVDFHHLPIANNDRRSQESSLEALLAGLEVEVVVLARYMQVLTPEFCARWANRCINIHHSFLPAFAGAQPYHQAHARGVKVIGATAHYVTADLDAGPIIAQGVTDVSHRDTVADFVRRGRELETTVLARAVAAHLEHRVLVDGDRTVVFA